MKIDFAEAVHIEICNRAENSLWLMSLVMLTAPVQTEAVCGCLQFSRGYGTGSKATGGHDSIISSQKSRAASGYVPRTQMYTEAPIMMPSGILFHLFPFFLCKRSAYSIQSIIQMSHCCDVTM